MRLGPRESIAMDRACAQVEFTAIESGRSISARRRRVRATCSGGGGGERDNIAEAAAATSGGDVGGGGGGAAPAHGTSARGQQQDPRCVRGGFHLKSSSLLSSPAS